MLKRQNAIGNTNRLIISIISASLVFNFLIFFRSLGYKNKQRVKRVTAGSFTVCLSVDLGSPKDLRIEWTGISFTRQRFVENRNGVMVE